MTAVAALLAVSFTGAAGLGPAAAPAQAAPGTPGTPAASTTLYTEDFQNISDPTQGVGITEYVSSSGVTYAADGGWNNPALCNGFVHSGLLSAASQAEYNFCPGWWPNSTKIATGLGMYQAMANPESNFVVAEQTYTGGNFTAADMLRTNRPVSLPAAGRFVTFSLDVGGYCNTGSGVQPKDVFYLTDGVQSVRLNDQPYNYCTDPGAESITVPGIAAPVVVGSIVGDRSYLMTGDTVGFRIENLEKSGSGNDQSFDNFQILDVTPQLDKAFSPTSVPQGQASTLTLTVTNTDELASKNGWSFRDALPEGLSVADGAASTTCAAGVVTAPAGATSVGVTGNLNAGQASCTVTVNVVADAPGSYTNGPDNITGTGINPPGESTVAFTSQPFQCDANGYLFQTPSAGVNQVQRVDLVTGEFETIFNLPTTVNAVGYNTLDNFFYAIQTAATPGAPVGSLLRIGSDGSVTSLGVPTGLPAGSAQIVGDFDANGQYFVTSSGATAGYYQIDLVPGSTTYGTVVDTGNRALPAGLGSFGADWGFTNNAFYSVGTTAGTAQAPGSNTLVRFDPATGTDTVVGTVTLPNGSALTSGIFGAVYVDAAGYLYGSDNTTGNIYRIDVTTGAAILLSEGPAAAGNDGARCALAPMPTLAVTKTVEGRQAPADQFTVALVDPEGTVQAQATTTGTANTVSTVNQPVSQGAMYMITDTMAAGSASAINAYNARIECLNTATGAAVPTAGTGPWTVTIPAAADFTCEVTNDVVPVGAELVKTADAAAQENIEAGQVITYSFAFTNTGQVPLTDIRINETAFNGSNGAPAVTCPTGAVAPGASVTCTATYTVSQADADRGSITNEATGTGTPPAGFPVPPVTPPSGITVPIVPEPGITVEKTASDAPITAAGQEITYSFLVTNTGNVTLGNVTVNEGEFSGTGELSDVVCPTTTLAPKATVTCIATYTTTQADVDADAGVITNEATVTGTPPGTGTPPITSGPDGAEVTINRTPAMTVVKSSDVAAGARYTLGQKITYSFVVTNTGNVTLNNATPVEGTFTGAGKLSAFDCPAGAASLAPGATVTCTATYTVVQADVDRGTIRNTATGTATPPTGSPEVPEVPSSEVTVEADQDPELSIVKAASEGVTRAGQEITYTFVVTNTGNVTIKDVSVVEGEFSGTPANLSDVICADGAAELAPNATVKCTATYTTTQADVEAGVITNTATGTGTPPNTSTPITSVPDDARVEFPAQPGVTVVKSADEQAQGELKLGQEITYSFLVKNTGNLILKDVVVNDVFGGAGNLSAITCPEGAASLAPGTEIVCTATYTVLQADVDAGFIENTATATGTPARGEAPVSPESKVTVPSVIDPELAIVKTASAGKITSAGQVITYSFLMTNTGNVTLRDAAVVEGEFSGTGKLSEVICPEGAAALIPGQSVTCTATYTTTAADLVAGTISNTATGTATIPGGGKLDSDPSTAKIITAPVLTPEEPAVQKPAPPAKGALANTGLTAGPLALGGLVLLLLGAGTVATMKMRHRKNA